MTRIHAVMAAVSSASCVLLSVACSRSSAQCFADAAARKRALQHLRLVGVEPLRQGLACPCLPHPWAFVSDALRPSVERAARKEAGSLARWLMGSAEEGREERGARLWDTGGWHCLLAMSRPDQLSLTLSVCGLGSSVAHSAILPWAPTLSVLLAPVHAACCGILLALLHPWRFQLDLRHKAPPTLATTTRS